MRSGTSNTTSARHVLRTLCESSRRKCRRLAGVESVKVHLDKGQVEVSFHPDQITLHQISDVIEEQGYDVV